jgi:predicted nucleotidyltransferase
MSTILTERPSSILARHTSEVKEIATSLGLNDVRVFGSVARKEDTLRSDIDFLMLLAYIPFLIW